MSFDVTKMECYWWKLDPSSDNLKVVETFLIDAEWTIPFTFVHSGLTIQCDSHFAFCDVVMSDENNQHCKVWYDISKLTTVGRLWWFWVGNSILSFHTVSWMVFYWGRKNDDRSLGRSDWGRGIKRTIRNNTCSTVFNALNKVGIHILSKDEFIQ